MTPSTAIVMSDNREPVVTSSDVTALTYPALAFALNALYAAQHGYALLYYRMAAPTCRHPWQGERVAAASPRLVTRLLVTRLLNGPHTQGHAIHSPPRRTHRTSKHAP